MPISNYPDYYSFFDIFKKFTFNWKIIALQNIVLVSAIYQRELTIGQSIGMSPPSHLPPHSNYYRL